MNIKKALYQIGITYVQDKFRQWRWFIQIAYRTAPGIRPDGRRRMYADLMAYIYEPDSVDEQQQRISETLEDLAEIGAQIKRPL